MTPPGAALRSVLRRVRDLLRRRARQRVMRLGARRLRPLRVVLGAGGLSAPGWLATDIDTLDIVRARDWRRVFGGSSIDVALAEHVWEHLTPEEAMLAASNCFNALKIDGYLRAAVPDGLHPSADYIEQVRPGGCGCGAEDHHVLYTYSSFSRLFQQCGFEVTLLEHFDEDGRFTFRHWRPETGMVHRSCRFDERNEDDPHAYTSIVLDAVKRTEVPEVTRCR